MLSVMAEPRLTNIFKWAADTILPYDLPNIDWNHLGHVTIFIFCGKNNTDNDTIYLSGQPCSRNHNNTWG